MHTTDFVQAYRAKTEHKVIGLMSGTSLDGVDAVLVSIKTDDEGNCIRITLDAMVSIPYSDAAKKKVAALCILGETNVEDLTLANVGLSHWNAKAVNMLIEHSNVDRSLVDMVCMHGQTVWHVPNAHTFPGPDGPVSITATLQLGNPQVVSLMTDLPVISDFRSPDMAVGGQGAPLAPFIDYLLFAQPGKGVAVQNIGGIGNVTVLPCDGGNEAVYAFDTGPGNMIIDALVGWGTDSRQAYDEGGRIAATGKVNEHLLSSLMADPYFAMTPPKSTGREVYGSAYTMQLIEKAKSLGMGFADMVATATAFTALTIARSYRDFVLPTTTLSRVVVSGGGARNKTLLAMLSSYLPEGIEVLRSDDLGVPDQAREAMAFALMGHASLLGLPANLPKVTGASKAVVLGTITMQQL